MACRATSVSVVCFAAWWCALATGCTSTDGLAKWSQAFSAGRTTLEQEEEHRRRFQTEGDPDSLRWLLAHRIQSGMSPTDVGRVLGDDGRREFDDRWLKTNGGYYRTGDVVYRWGPDKSGQSVYLVFRDRQLVNFDPEAYRQPSADEDTMAK